MAAAPRCCPLCDGVPTAETVCSIHGLPTVDLEVLENPPSALEIGMVVADKFRIERRVEKGGMGALFLATQLGVNRTVALKVLRSEGPLTINLVKRFYSEARAMGSLKHPHIAQVIDFGVDARTRAPFLVMEFIEGETLRRLISKAPLAEVPAARLLAQVAWALDQAHSAGLIHRDLKPENLMVTRLRSGELHAKVIDFGIAKFLPASRPENPARDSRDDAEGLTRPGTVVGSAFYMSPEQARAETVDSRTDLYSLGCVLFEVLTRRPPFDGESAARVMWHHANSPPPSLPEKLVDGAPPSAALNRLLAGLLSKSRSGRPAGAAEVATALEAIAARADPKIMPRPFEDEVTRKPAEEERPSRPSPGGAMGRFELRHKIGEGGFGAVFEAFDPVLRRRVAVKVMKADLGFDESDPAGHSALERFRREAEAAARLNHPNVVTCHELGVQDGLPYIVMELLEGQTLQARLKSGPFSPREAVAVSIEIARGLVHAHEAGVLHRDLKPGNVFICPNDQIKVLDFGLARMHETIPYRAIGSEPAETGDGMPPAMRGAGTPGYMAPEQWEGEEGDARTDVFAAGVMLYRMIAGRLPFPTGSEVETPDFTSKAPPPLHATVPDVSESLEALIRRAVAPAPEARFQSARELLEALVAQKAAPPAEQKPHRRRWVMNALAAGAISMGALAVWKVADLANRTTNQLAAQVPSRSEAVLGFKLTSRDPTAALQEEDAWLETALSDLLTRALASGGRLRLAPSQDVARAKLELGLAQKAIWAPEAIARIAGNLGVDEIVLGAYEIPTDAKDSILIHVTVENARTGEMVASSSARGERPKLAELVESAAGGVREKLGLLARSTPKDGALAALFPSTARAARPYAEAVAKERSFDLLGARQGFEQVVAFEPDFALGHAALARVRSALGDERAALEESKRALELSGKLGREERLAIEAAYHDATHDHARAVEIHRTLATSFPDNIEYGLALVEALKEASRYADAEAALGNSRKLPPPLSNDPRFDLMEAELAGVTHDLERMRGAADRAIATSKSRGQRSVEGLALLQRGIALSDTMGRKSALSAFERAKRIFAELGDRANLGRALRGVGEAHRLGGELAAAMKAFEEAASVQHEIGSKVNEANTLIFVAIVGNEVGDMRGARKAIDEAIELRRSLELKGSVAQARSLRAKFAESSGDLLTAKRDCEEIAATLRDESMTNETYLCARALGNVARDEGDLATARVKMEEALALAMDKKLRLQAEIARVTLAELSLDAGHVEVADALVSAAIGEIAKLQHSDSELLAHALRARIMVAAGRIEEARTEARLGAERATKSQNLTYRLMVARTSALVDAASGRALDLKRAIAALGASIERATPAGILGEAFEARLLRAELELRSGRRPQATQRLRALERDATEHGFLRIARRAGAAIKE